jgi:hypothetical protein
MKTRSQTRSQTSKIMYEVVINFDEASNEWKSNKKYVGNGCYKYICNKLLKNGNNCKKQPIPGMCYCKVHNI